MTTTKARNVCSNTGLILETKLILYSTTLCITAHLTPRDSLSPGTFNIITKSFLGDLLTKCTTCTSTICIRDSSDGKQKLAKGNGRTQNFYHVILKFEKNSEVFGLASNRRSIIVVPPSTSPSSGSEGTLRTPGWSPWCLVTHLKFLVFVSACFLRSKSGGRDAVLVADYQAFVMLSCVKCFNTFHVKESWLHLDSFPTSCIGFSSS